MSITRREILKVGVGMGSLALLSPIHAMAQANAAPRRGGVLIEGFPSEPNTLTAAYRSSNAGSRITPKLFDGLLTYDFDFTPKPQLASSWEVSPDGLVYTFHLREGVKWHDGVPFTSADVAFSLQEAWKKYLPRGLALFAHLEDVDTPDPLTVRWKLSQPTPFTLVSLSSFFMQPIPKHLYEGTDILENPANLNPVGTGPFRFAEWSKGNYLRLVRNEDYWDQPKPYLDEVIFRFIPDSAARSAALEAGDINIVGESQLPGVDLARFRNIPGFTVSTKGYAYIATVHFIVFNVNRPHISDVRVRRAIAHALDPQFIADNIWFGFAQPATGPIPRQMGPAYTPDTPQYPFDVEKANALLDEAGLPRGANGVRFELMIDPQPGQETYLRTSEYVREALAKVGIAVTVRTQDSASYSKRVYTDFDYDMVTLATSIGPDFTVAGQTFFWSKAYRPGVATSNYSGYMNPELDVILEAAAVEVDPDKRNLMFHEVQRIVQRDLPHITLADVDLVTVHDEKFVNHTVGAEGIKANYAEAYFTE